MEIGGNNSTAPCKHVFSIQNKFWKSKPTAEALDALPVDDLNRSGGFATLTLPAPWAKPFFVMFWDSNWWPNKWRKWCCKGWDVMGYHTFGRQIQYGFLVNFCSIHFCDAPIMVKTTKEKCKNQSSSIATYERYKMVQVTSILLWLETFLHLKSWLPKKYILNKSRC